MKDNKRLKDPIYGYITIPTVYMDGIIDTACFQRLRRIIQTSYSPLYSSAVHNRFVHSIGVFHLGQIASCTIKSEIEKKKYSVGFNIERFCEVFQLACLLHDVGHAPFSHTGESFYLGKKRCFDELHKKLKLVVDSEKFSKDVPTEKASAAAPHEIMSAIVGLMQFKEFFKYHEEREFFARCIIGYKYQDKTLDSGIKNCFIQLLNSKVIDVDKLDYLIRDAYTTGFATVAIDYERLLGALTISEEEGRFEIAYYKDAVSVIENVVYAHDSERKWIQNHPAVIYETFILQRMMDFLCEQIEDDDKRLFCLESLGTEGQILRNGISIRLLCDDDIIYLTKNIFKNDFTNEYFNRIERRHPVWKSEAEYKAVFMKKAGGEIYENFEKAMSATAKYLGGQSDVGAINDEFIEKISKELEEIDKQSIDDLTKKAQIEEKTRILKVAKCLKELSEKKGAKCDFIIIKASQFNSGFGKPDFTRTTILFHTDTDHFKGAKFGDIVSSITAKDTGRDDYFYLFYKRAENSDIEYTSSELCNILIKEFV